MIVKICIRDHSFVFFFLTIVNLTRHYVYLCARLCVKSFIICLMCKGTFRRKSKWYSIKRVYYILLHGMFPSSYLDLSPFLTPDPPHLSSHSLPFFFVKFILKWKKLCHLGFSKVGRTVLDECVVDPNSLFLSGSVFTTS